MPNVYYFKNFMWMKRASNKTDFFYIESCFGTDNCRFLTKTSSGDLVLREKQYPCFSAIPMAVIETKNDGKLQSLLNSAEDKINTVILSLSSSDVILITSDSKIHRLNLEQQTDMRLRLLQLLYNQLESNLIIIVHKVNDWGHIIFILE